MGCERRGTGSGSSRWAQGAGTAAVAATGLGSAFSGWRLPLAALSAGAAGVWRTLRSPRAFRGVTPSPPSFPLSFPAPPAPL